MTRKKTGAPDWTDSLLGDSDVPSDDFTWSQGSNYGLDGFQFDTEPNSGVLDGARLPTVHGLSGLPEGLVTAEEPEEMPSFAEMNTDLEGGFHLGSMLSEEEGALPLSEEDRRLASLVDLAWLDPTQPQDPERLPKELRPDQPPLHVEPELAEAWGVDRRTDGLKLIPNQDREVAVYEQSLQEGPKSGLPGVKVGADDFIEIANRALRRAHYGHALPEIWEEAGTLLGPNDPRAAALRERLSAEYGLLGTVFVRASAFPNILDDRWAAQVRKVARTARYVITADEAVASKLGMTAVAKVPWKAALAYYAPRLRVTGHRLASEGTPQEILRAAFLAGPAAVEHVATPKPVEHRPVASSDEVVEALQGARQAAQERDASFEKGQMAKLAKYVQRWVRGGLMTEAEAGRLMALDKPAADLLRLASVVTTQREKSKTALTPTETREYQGHVQTVAPQVAPKTADFSEGDRRVLAAAKGTGIRASEFHSLLRYARQQMSEGWAGREFDTLLRTRFSSPLLIASADLLTALRQEHEGLSGHAYVDAGAYASKSGVAGCETGGLKHRANPIKYVLAMSRCSSCTLRNANDLCTKYGKVLVDAAPVKDRTAYQAKSIHYADAPDQEVTASLFDPGEYGLTNSNLTDIELEGPPAGELGEVLFGGGIDLS